MFLIRHASHDLLGKALAGRADGVGLNARGREEAQRLVTQMQGVPLRAVHTSPRQRARETAEPLCRQWKLEAQPNEAIDEIDFGDWTGRSFDHLATEPEWEIWNTRRSAAQPPRGETIGAVQKRVFGEMKRLTGAHDGSAIALVSHGDVIKAALSAVLGSPLDALEQFEIAPASVSVVAMGDGWCQVRCINHTGSVAEA